MFHRAKICQNGGYTTIRTDSEKLENYIDIIYRNIYKFAAVAAILAIRSTID